MTHFFGSELLATWVCEILPFLAKRYSRLQVALSMPTEPSKPIEGAQAMAELRTTNPLPGTPL
jgi:hypothetical protein